MSTPTTLQEFVDACEVPGVDIFELFEFDIPQSLRVEILSVAPSDCKEPVRYALNKLGQTYSCMPLLYY